jgi:hypothetical protein
LPLEFIQPGQMTSTEYPSTYLEPTHPVSRYRGSEQARQAGLAQGYGQRFGFPVARQQPHMAYDLLAGFIMSTDEDMPHYLIA